MSVLRILLLAAFIVTFGGFIWAMGGGFFRSVERTPLGLRIIQVAGAIFAAVHAVALITNAIGGPSAVVGLMLYAASVGLFWRCVWINRFAPLSLAFSHDAPDHLVTAGPYRLVRHPFYLAYLLAWTAGVIATTQPLLLPSLVFMAVLYRAAATIEERKFLTSSFAGEYRAYQARTGMFIPRVRRIPKVTLLAMLALLMAVPSLAGAASNPASNRPGQAAAPGDWLATGSLHTARSGHSATLLRDGKVLVAGGVLDVFDQTATPTAELFDPATGTWSTTGSLMAARAHHVAIRLPDDRVLVLGGYDRDIALSTVELYDPATGRWSPGSPMDPLREGFEATLLNDGNMLVTGGYNRVVRTYLASAEFYDPASDSWSAVASMGTPRAGHVATLLADGWVLVAGGTNGPNQGGLASAELHNPATNSWSATGSMTSTRDDDDFGRHAQVFPFGGVLAVGGYHQGVLNTAELYTPGTGTWSPIASMQAGRETQHTATLMADGTVLVVGGFDDSGPVATTEVFDPATGRWSATVPPAAARAGHSATTLLNGRVLVASGWGGTAVLASSELFTPVRHGRLVPVTPARVLDTRVGTGAPVGKLGANQVLSLQVTGRGGVPSSEVGAVVLNLTVTQPTASSFLTVYPAGTARPATSNLNFVAGQTLANLVVVKVGSGGKVNIFNASGATHVLADINAWSSARLRSLP
jgi:protein-S-isoprenylcysteine O-methyltransferase Ste14